MSVSPVQRYPDSPAVAVVAYRLARAHMRKVYDDSGGPGRAGPHAEALLAMAEEGSLPPFLLDPLVALVAQLVVRLLATPCGATPATAAGWLQARPPFGFRGLRIRRAVRELAHECVAAGWNPDLLAEAADEQARGMTEAAVRQLAPEARRVVTPPAQRPPNSPEE